MLGQLQDAGNTTTIAHYLELLETAFLLSGLESTVRLIRSSSPKLILWNNALVSALNRYSFEEAQSDHAWWGRLVENAVGAQLFINNLAIGNEITYWREKGYEVDFCINTGDSRLGIEVKSGALESKSGIEHFKKRYPKSKILIVGTGGLSLEEFFANSGSISKKCM
jgi:hypothetical protein